MFNRAFRAALPVAAILFGFLACALIHAQTADLSAWKMRPGLEGGFVEFLFGEGSDLFAGSHDFGVYRLPGGKGSWEQVGKGMPNRTVSGMTQAPYGLLAESGHRIYILSEDHTSWSELSRLPQVGGGWSTPLHADDSLLLAADDSALYRSPDRGRTWTTQYRAQLPPITCFARLGRFLFAGQQTGKQILRSADTGKTWKAPGAGLPLDTALGGANALLARGGRLVAASYSGLFVSADSGVHWTRAKGSVPAAAEFYGLAASDSALYATSLAHGLFRSADGGDTWAGWNAPDSAEGALLSIAPLAGDLWLGTEYGVLRRPAGSALWTETNAGLQGAGFHRLTCSGPRLAAFSQRGLYLSQDTGATWERVVLTGEAQDIEAAALLGGRLYIGNQNGLFSLNVSPSLSPPRKIASGWVSMLAVMGATLVFNVEGDMSFQRLWPDSDSLSYLPGPSIISTQDPLDGGAGWLRGLDPNGLYWEYRTEPPNLHEWTVAQPVFDGLSAFGEKPIVIDGNGAAWEVRAKNESISFEPFPLPFALQGFCHDGGWIFAAAEGGTAQYLGPLPVSSGAPRATRGSSPKAAAGPRRAALSLFPSGPGAWRDATGKIRSR